ncbi:MAG: hypothetical protein LBM00_10635 [Deltaproteobacteria bacterium]|jgi:hypothetical protein|nr:hypothetical protein [Deltaproteobacteria bacterium]
MSGASKSSYSILLMRDDNTVSTFRLRTFWFKLAAVLLLVILGTCGASIYGLLHFQDKYLLAAQNLEVMQTELNETKVKLQDHANLAVLPYGDPSPGNLAASRSYALNNVVQPFRSGSEQGNPGNTASTQPDRPVPGDGSSPASGQGAGGKPALEDMQELLGQTAPVTTAGLNAAGGDPEGADTYPVQISNVSASVEAGKKLRINFDINNVPQKTTLSGNCYIFGITRQGDEVELAPVIRGALTFRISRFRSMRATLALPDNLPPSEIVRLRVNVSVIGLPPYWKFFPVSL